MLVSELKKSYEIEQKIIDLLEIILKRYGEEIKLVTGEEITRHILEIQLEEENIDITGILRELIAVCERLKMML